MQNSMLGVIVKESIALANRTTGAGVVNGAAIDVTGVKEIVHVINATAVAAGSIKIQDVQFANDSSFSVNVSTFTSDDYLIKNDTMSATSAINQTTLAAAGSSKITLRNLALGAQKYMRVRAVASAGSPDTTAQVVTVLSYGDAPQVQS